MVLQGDLVGGGMKPLFEAARHELGKALLRALDHRHGHPETRLEAITSRPLLLSGVARLTQHAGQSRLLLTLTHAAGDQIKRMIANVRKGLDTVLATAPQLTKPERWTALVRYIVARIIEAAPKIHPPTALRHAISAPVPTG